jgi:hypothetical protein
LQVTNERNNQYAYDAEDVTRQAQISSQRHWQERNGAERLGLNFMAAGATVVSTER